MADGNALSNELLGPRELAAIEIAREKYTLGSDNNIEIDDAPACSTGEDGIWVAAWVFVYRGDIDTQVDITE